MIRLTGKIIHNTPNVICMRTDSRTDRHIFTPDSGISSHSFGCSYSLACNTSEASCLLFAEFAPSATVFSSGNSFLQHVRASGETSVIHDYLINSYCFLTSEITTEFLETTTCNYYAATPNPISLGHRCHRHARSGW
jgi:hypothetical protein